MAYRPTYEGSVDSLGNVTRPNGSRVSADDASRTDAEKLRNRDLSRSRGIGAPVLPAVGAGGDVTSYSGSRYSPDFAANNPGLQPAKQESDTLAAGGKPVAASSVKGQIGEVAPTLSNPVPVAAAAAPAAPSAHELTYQHKDGSWYGETKAGQGKNFSSYLEAKNYSAGGGQPAVAPVAPVAPVIPAVTAKTDSTTAGVTPLVSTPDKPISPDLEGYRAKYPKSLPSAEDVKAATPTTGGPLEGFQLAQTKVSPYELLTAPKQPAPFVQNPADNPIAQPDARARSEARARENMASEAARVEAQKGKMVYDPRTGKNEPMINYDTRTDAGKVMVNNDFLTGYPRLRTGFIAPTQIARDNPVVPVIPQPTATPTNSLAAPARVNSMRKKFSGLPDVTTGVMQSGNVEPFDFPTIGASGSRRARASVG